LQENIHLFDDIDADLYAISVDSPSNHKQLKEAGAFTYSFVTDSSLEVLEHVNMKNDQISYRGVSILDQDGAYVYHEINDLWGEQIEETSAKIHEQIKELND
jgi:alkyl hydroperoxide reductase subunit AhpC